MKNHFKFIVAMVTVMFGLGGVMSPVGAVVHASELTEQAYYVNSELPMVSNETGDAELAVAPIIIVGAKLLAKAGFTWLATKLYEQGAKSFCKSYKNSNNVTRQACGIMGY